MCTAGVKDAASSVSDSAKMAQKEAERRYQAEAQRASETNVSGKAMEQFEGGMRNVDSMGRVVGEEAQRWGDAAASIVGMGKGESAPAQSDTVEANYSKSSSEKSSKSTSKAKKKGGEGTGGSKSQFYAKK
tara:strand:+ start:307 stop:699 length:393 start_codon:yes stop_codon:yes gene_type:complete